MPVSRFLCFAALAAFALPPAAAAGGLSCETLVPKRFILETFKENFSFGETFTKNTGTTYKFLAQCRGRSSFQTKDATEMKKYILRMKGFDVRVFGDASAYQNIFGMLSRNVENDKSGKSSIKVTNGHGVKSFEYSLRSPETHFVSVYFVAAGGRMVHVMASGPDPFPAEASAALAGEVEANLKNAGAVTAAPEEGASSYSGTEGIPYRCESLLPRSEVAKLCGDEVITVRENRNQAGASGSSRMQCLYALKTGSNMLSIIIESGGKTKERFERDLKNVSKSKDKKAGSDIGAASIEEDLNVGRMFMASVTVLTSSGLVVKGSMANGSADHLAEIKVAVRKAVSNMK